MKKMKMDNIIIRRSASRLHSLSPVNVNGGSRPAWSWILYLPILILIIISGNSVKSRTVNQVQQLFVFVKLGHRSPKNGKREARTLDHDICISIYHSFILDWIRNLIFVVGCLKESRQTRLIEYSRRQWWVLLDFERGLGWSLLERTQFWSFNNVPGACTGFPKFNSINMFLSNLFI